MNSVELRVNAKINLSLNITGRTNNGYHCLDMVTASVNISDAVFVSVRGDKQLNVKMFDGAGKRVEISEKANSAYKAAFMLIKGFALPGADIVIKKGIPFSGGLGGSSADAAGVISALGMLNRVDVKSSGAYIVAFKSGSDVPYMLDGGFAHVFGRGEKVNRITFPDTLHLVVAKGAEGCSAKTSYGKYDALTAARGGASGAAAGVTAMLKAIKEKDLHKICAAMRNDLQPASIGVCPGIRETLALLEETRPLRAMMSGSGSACFAVYGSSADAAAAAETLRGKTDFVTAASTEQRGISVIK